MPTIKLKPCPFCGSFGVVMFHYDDDEGNPRAESDQLVTLPDEILERNPDGLFSIECYDCGCGTMRFRKEDEAVTAWNRRVGEQPQSKKRRDKRKCVHFRFQTVTVAHDWCAKYGPHYECLGAHGCGSYEERKQEGAKNND